MPNYELKNALPKDVIKVTPKKAGEDGKVQDAGQPEYEPLPAVRICDPVDGHESLYTLWVLTDDERDLIAGGANVELQLLTFGKPLQPVALGVAGRFDEDGDLVHKSSILMDADGHWVEVGVVEAEPDDG